MAASITGRHTEILEGRHAHVRRVRPMSDVAGGLTLRLDTRQRLGEAATRKDFTTLQTSGDMPVRARGRFVAAKLSIAAGQPWSYLQGIDITVAVGGKR